MSDRKYTLELTEEQAAVLVRATEALARIGMGQFHYAILDNTTHMPGYQDVDRHCEAREHLKQVTDLLGQPTFYQNGGPSIHNEAKMPNAFRTAWDLSQVVRHQLAWDRTPEGGIGVHFHEPLRTGDEPLPRISKQLPSTYDDFEPEDFGG